MLGLDNTSGPTVRANYHRSEGTDLGIAQYQRLVGTAGGCFLVDSELGKGTIVTIMLPTA